MADGSQAALLLAKQLRDLNKNPVEGFSAGLVDDSNVFEWEIMIIGPTDTPYEGGFFKARMVFPKDYPNMPPKLTFTSKFYHPNVYEDGRVCISILHSPGEDQMSGESSGERWLPIHTVESILLSVISMISSPNPDSPANVDAAVCETRAQHLHASSVALRPSLADRSLLVNTLSSAPLPGSPHRRRSSEMTRPLSGRRSPAACAAPRKSDELVFR